ncbi:hypothetical protein QUA20_29940 [Microcoleus sp. Pol7_A1]|uniref:hypothetical protein n=1 Tax=Microcoleus sp. Pol7_A1 TaxID=2818893 RepID=UPI002FD14F70
MAQSPTSPVAARMGDGKDVSVVGVQQIDLFARPVSHSLHPIFLSAYLTIIHACLTLERSPSENTQNTQQQKLAWRAHTVPATPGFFNLLSSSWLTGRGRPFRFIRNHSMATATNVYLMLYPKPALAKVLLEKPELLKEVWQGFDRIFETLMDEGRVYGWWIA